jgi:hypothetical protein
MRGVVMAASGGKAAVVHAVAVAPDVVVADDELDGLMPGSTHTAR